MYEYIEYDKNRSIEAHWNFKITLGQSLFLRKIGMCLQANVLLDEY